MFQVKALVVTTNSRRRAFARNVNFSFIISGSERSFTFRVSVNTLPTLATLVQDIIIFDGLTIPDFSTAGPINSLFEANVVPKATEDLTTTVNPELPHEHE